ncbi:SRPBCC family protein [Brachybacterium paraconglomeratum]|uniref:SRPBCC family protein n=1 Tax=Brachybacterium paraconglomeratum TaxID=173362 RepID=UPI0022AEDCB3|nr:SRPBCC family protein [Brachybacterium paraconglomeratum]MCZ4326265.1 SRPBCC family protein [Brachybacterium paraconglomeratum]
MSESDVEALEVTMPHRHRPPLGPWGWGTPEMPVPSDPDDEPAPAGSRLALRAVESDASPGTLFLWLCHLRRAPYSYDLLDNLGRRRPRQADPRMMQLARGQAVRTIFELTGFAPGRSRSLRIAPGLSMLLFGALALRYDVLPLPGSRSLLQASLWWSRPPGPFGTLRRYLLAWGDVLMMRRQLLTLRALAERDEEHRARS